jgi:hypothetical protein
MLSLAVKDMDGQYIQEIGPEQEKQNWKKYQNEDKDQTNQYEEEYDDRRILTVTKQLLNIGKEI